MMYHHHLHASALEYLRAARQYLYAMRNLMAVASLIATLSACQSPLDPRIEAVMRGPGHVQERGGDTTEKAGDDREVEDVEEPIKKRGEKAER